MVAAIQTGFFRGMNYQYHDQSFVTHILLAFCSKKQESPHWRALADAQMSIFSFIVHPAFMFFTSLAGAASAWQLVALLTTL